MNLIKQAIKYLLFHKSLKENEQIHFLFDKTSDNFTDHAPFNLNELIQESRLEPKQQRLKTSER